LSFIVAFSQTTTWIGRPVEFVSTRRTGEPAFAVGGRVQGILQFRGA
jgi:hypothetical protein